MQIKRVTAPTLTIHRNPSTDAEATSECLYGERLKVIEDHNQWCRILCEHDGYEGYVQTAYTENIDKQRRATHWVQVRSTLLFKDASIKSPVLLRIPFQSQLSIAEPSDSPFSRTSCGHYLWREHLLPSGVPHKLEPLPLARSHFLSSPYLWGGRSTAGLDCSGLIQALARARGLSIPRDSHEQENAIEPQIELSERRPMDLVFWPGHVGILLTADELLHATAHHLGCIVEPLENVVQRAGTISSVRRLFAD
ncbi:MAG: C40 family peptidase [Granulosicoccus sp.]|nr:C40 family peptidase [Granulosicoccus sp.]